MNAIPLRMLICSLLTLFFFKGFCQSKIQGVSVTGTSVYGSKEVEVFDHQLTFGPHGRIIKESGEVLGRRQGNLGQYYIDYEYEDKGKLIKHVFVRAKDREAYEYGGDIEIRMALDSSCMCLITTEKKLLSGNGHLLRHISHLFYPSTPKYEQGGIPKAGSIALFPPMKIGNAMQVDQMRMTYITGNVMTEVYYSRDNYITYDSLMLSFTRVSAEPEESYEEEEGFGWIDVFAYTEVYADDFREDLPIRTTLSGAFKYFTVYRFDHQGNWIEKKTFREGRITNKVERRITYY